MVAILAIIWLIIFITLILSAVFLGFADKINEARGEETIYPEGEDFE